MTSGGGDSSRIFRKAERQNNPQNTKMSFHLPISRFVAFHHSHDSNETQHKRQFQAHFLLLHTEVTRQSPFRFHKQPSRRCVFLLPPETERERGVMKKKLTSDFGESLQHFFPFSCLLVWGLFFIADFASGLRCSQPVYKKNILCVMMIYDRILIINHSSPSRISHAFSFHRMIVSQHQPFD